MVIKMVIIDPGHGGSDPGGGTNQYWKEKNINLDISLYQYNRLKELGVPVALTRYIDEDLSPSNRIARVRNIAPSAVGKNILISNHVNIDYGNFDGAEIIYSINKKDTLPRLIASNLSLKGQKLSSNGIYTRTLPNGQDYYFIIRDTYPYESLIVEYGFADSKGDDINQIRFNRYELAEAVVKSIVEYLGYSYETSTTNYTVKSGDTLYKIASLNNTTINEIKKLNNLTSDTLTIGQKLLIPISFAESNVISYKVKQGDSLYSIANTFGVSVDTIKKANKLLTNTIFPNQTLIIPVDGKNITTYTVKSGDSLYSIAQANNVTVDFIKSINNLSSNTIYAGQKLLV